MTKKLLLTAILAIFLIGMICAYACEPVEAKPVAKIKKVKNYYKAKFQYKGHTYKAKLKENKYYKKYYGERGYDTTKKIRGHTFTLYHTKNPNGYDRYGWNFCKQRNSPYEGHLYYKVKWI